MKWLLLIISPALTSAFALHAPRLGARPVAPGIVPRVSCASVRLSESTEGEGSDYARCLVYPAATVTQWTVIAGLLRAIDSVGTLPGILVPPLFGFLALRSRVFSILAARRPDRAAQEGKATPKDVKRPWWTPPGIAFPFIWITIAVLRSWSSLLVWRASGRVLCSWPLLALVAHLCVGDTWNCVANVEKRLGTSALGVVAVLASAYYAVAQYAACVPKAGYVLAPMAVWITIATVLTWTIWAINEPRQPLLPQKDDGKSCPLQLPLADVLRK